MIKNYKIHPHTKVLAKTCGVGASQKGYVISIITFFSLVIMLSIALSVSSLTFYRQKVAANAVKSTQAYYTAEAGIEDALIRLSRSPQMPAVSYDFTVNGSTATISIPGAIAGSRTIISEGDLDNRIRKLQLLYAIDSTQVSFHYGVQVGDLGLIMKGNSEIYGNVFSSGTITGESNAEVYGDAISAGSSGKIKGIDIRDNEGGGNAWAQICENSSIDGELHYATKASCTAGTYDETSVYIEAEDMPISSDQITEWKNEALAGGVEDGYILEGNDKDSLGPKKVEGNMTLDSNAILTMTGTVWVTGNLNLNSNAAVQLSPGYSSFSGVIIVDGKITVTSNVVLCGSEGYNESKRKCNTSAGSYLMLLSTKNSSDPNNPAISATSNSKTAVLYASDGYIRLSSNADLKEATGRGIYMDSNAVVRYETGLANPLFSSGPSGGWEVKSWSEY